MDARREVRMGRGRTIGPRAGPMNGAAEKITIPSPRSSASNRSATVPPG
jgi:hypothetical protein